MKTPKGTTTESTSVLVGQQPLWDLGESALAEQPVAPEGAPAAGSGGPPAPQHRPTQSVVEQAIAPLPGMPGQLPEPPMPITTATHDGAMRVVPIDALLADPDQPRRQIHATALQELAASISRYGILQPPVVRAIEPDASGQPRYMMIAGARRLAAATAVGLSTMPVTIVDRPEEDMRLLQLVENLQRADLEPVDEARAFVRIMAERHWSARELGAAIHRSHSYVADRLLLTRYPEVALAVSTQQLAPTLGTSIAREADPAARANLLARAGTGTLNRRALQGSRVAESAHQRRPHRATAAEHDGSAAAVPASADGSLSRLLVATAGPAVVASLLRWAMQQDWTLAQLLARVDEFAAAQPQRLEPAS